jgi:hypothetical protein
MPRLYNEAAFKADGSQHSMLGGWFVHGRLAGIFHTSLEGK